MKKPIYLPSGYKNRKRTTVTGRSKSGEISPKGLVAHTEFWDGRVAADAAPTTIRYIVNPDGTLRPMTFQEMVDRGHFIVGKGPTGVVNLKGSHDS